MSTCNRLDLKTLGFQLVMPKILPGQCFRCQILTIDDAIRPQKGLVGMAHAKQLVHRPSMGIKKDYATKLFPLRMALTCHTSITIH